MSKKPQQTAGAIDLAEAAERLGLSLKTMQVIVEHGILNGFQDADGRWKVALDMDGGLSTAPDVRAARTQAEAQSVPLRTEAARSRVEPPKPQPEVRAAEPPPQAKPAPPPQPPQAAAEVAVSRPAESGSTVERLLAEQVEYLRDQLDKRDRVLAEKDTLVGELMLRLMKLSRTAVKRVGADPLLRDELDRTKAEQSKLRDKHEHAMRNIGDVLSSVRDYLARQRPKR